MPSHVIIGASRGIGYGFLQYLSQDPSNEVYGLCRDVEATERKVLEDGLERVTLFTADMDDYKSLVRAAGQVAASTGGSADYVWINGAFMSTFTAEKFFSDFSPNEHDAVIEDFQTHLTTNVIGVINSHNAFLPLVRKSSIKKIITLSTAMSDMHISRQFGIHEAAAYSISKAAVNAVVAKYDCRHRAEGILFLAICPGNVYTGNPLQAEVHKELPRKLTEYQPNFLNTAKTPIETIPMLLKVANDSNPETDGGAFYPHKGKGQKYI